MFIAHVRTCTVDIFIKVQLKNAKIYFLHTDAQQGPPTWHPAPLPVQQAAREASNKASALSVDIAKLALSESIK